MGDKRKQLFINLEAMDFIFQKIYGFIYPVNTSLPDVLKRDEGKAVWKGTLSAVSAIKKEVSSID